MSILLALALCLRAPTAQLPSDPSFDSYLAHVAAAEAGLRLADLESFRRWLAKAPAQHRGFEWRWLDSLRDQSLATIPGEAALTALELSRDGRLLATGDAKGELVVRSVSDGTELYRVQAHADEISDVGFDPAGARIVCAAHDRKARIFDARTGRQLLEFGKHGFPLGGAVFSPDGTRIASCAYERPPNAVVGMVHVWDAATGEVSQTLEAGRKPLSCIAFSPDGRSLAVGSWDFCVFVWDLAAGGEARKLAMPDEGKYNAVDALAFSPDGLRIVAASKDDTARVWNLASGELVHSLRGHGNHVASVGFTPDGARIFSGSGDQTLRLWDASSGASLAVLRGAAGGVRASAAAPDGASLWSASADGELRRWSLDPRGYDATLLRTSSAAYSCVFTPDGSRLATCSYDGRVQLWDARSWDELASWQAHPRPSSCHILACSPDGRRLYSGSYDKTIAIWDTATLAEIGRLPLEGGAYVGRLSPGGDVFAVGQTNRKIALWDVLKREQRLLLPQLSNTVNDLAFSPDGRWLAAAVGDGFARVWRVADGTEVVKLEGGGANSALFTPDGRHLLVGSEDVREYRTSDWTLVRTMDAGRNSASRLSLSRDGTRLAIASRDAVLVDLPRGEITLALRSHVESLWFLEWSPDGQRLATAAMDGTVGIHDPRPVGVRLEEARAARAEQVEAEGWLAARLASGGGLAALAEETRTAVALEPGPRLARLAAITVHAGAALPRPEAPTKTGLEAGGGR